MTIRTFILVQLVRAAVAMPMMNGARLLLVLSHLRSLCQIGAALCAVSDGRSLAPVIWLLHAPISQWHDRFTAI